MGFDGYCQVQGVLVGVLELGKNVVQVYGGWVLINEWCYDRF